MTFCAVPTKSGLGALDSTRLALQLDYLDRVHGVDRKRFKVSRLRLMSIISKINACPVRLIDAGIL